MLGNPEIKVISKPTQFSSTNQPKKNGRKPIQIRKFAKDNNLSITDQVNIFQNIIIKFSAEEIKTMVQSRIYPDGKPLNGLIWGFLLAWIADCKRGMSAGGIFSQMTDRKYGTVKNKLELSGSVDMYVTLTPEERKKRMDEIERKRHERDGDREPIIAEGKEPDSC